MPPWRCLTARRVPRLLGLVIHCVLPPEVLLVRCGLMLAPRGMRGPPGASMAPVVRALAG
eukprot:5462713-Alexandrium_andersonii.AAC.1